MADTAPFSLNDLDPETRAIAERAARAAGLSVEEWILRAILRKVGGRLPPRPKGPPASPQKAGTAEAGPMVPERELPLPLEAGPRGGVPLGPLAAPREEAEEAAPDDVPPLAPVPPQEAAAPSEDVTDLAEPAPDTARRGAAGPPELAFPVGFRAPEAPPMAPEAAPAPSPPTQVAAPVPEPAPREPISDRDLLAALNALAAKVGDAALAPAGPSGPPVLDQKEETARTPFAAAQPSPAPPAADRPVARPGLPPKDLDELKRALARIGGAPLPRQEGAASTEPALAAPPVPGATSGLEDMRAKIIELNVPARATAKGGRAETGEPLRVPGEAPGADLLGAVEAPPLELTEALPADGLFVEPAEAGPERAAGQREKKQGPRARALRALIAGVGVLAVLAVGSWLYLGSIQGTAQGTAAAAKLGTMLDQVTRALRSISGGTRQAIEAPGKEAAPAPPTSAPTGAAGQSPASSAQEASTTAGAVGQAAAPGEGRASVAPTGQLSAPPEQAAAKPAPAAQASAPAPQAGAEAPGPAEGGVASSAGEPPAEQSSTSAAPSTPPTTASLPASPPKAAPAPPQEEGAARPAAPAKPSQPTEKAQPGSVQELEALAKRGDARAQHDLAMIYARGDRLSKDYAKAAYWFRESALQGIAGAQYNLAVLYEQGLGVEKDPLEALLWYLSAAEQGHPAAQYNVGVAYAEGKGIPQNYGEARKWFAKATQQGLARGAYNLGVLDELGLGAAKNEIEAVKWYKLAVRGGEADAERRLDGLVKRMTPEHIAEATRRYQAAAAEIPLKPPLRAERGAAKPVGRPANPAAASKGQPSSPPGAAAPAGPSASAPSTSGGAPLGGSQVISEIQRLLDTLGYDPGPPDGRLGSRTVAAIRAFQREAGLPVDGQATPELLQYIKKLSGKS